MGSFITGGSSGNTQAVVKFSGLQVGTSQFDKPIPILWGQRRLSYNAIWYNDFKAHKVSSKGKGGGKGPQQYDYTAAVILALCEGTVDSILNVWASASTTTTTTLSKLGFIFFDGDAAQAPWSFVVTKYPAEALSYALTSYLANQKLDLGASATIPENAFECVRLNGFTDTLVAPGWTNPTTHVNTPGTDVSMADFLPDWLTNPQYGMGFTSSDFPSLTVFRQYQDGQGLYFSPLLVNQETATDIINRWAQMANTWIYWNGTQFTFVPLGDSTVGSYVPDLDAAYDLTLDDFTGSVPVTVTRKDPADCQNRTVINFTDRTLGYVSNNAEYKDQTLVDKYGLRDASTTQIDEICNPAVAEIVKQLVGKRNAYIRNTYAFNTSYRYIRILPGTIVTLTEPNIGLNKFRVRVTKVDEDDNYDLAFEAEELPPLIGSYFPITGPGTHVPTTPDAQIDPGNVNTPAVVEPDSSFTAGTPQLIISASGGGNWGGCEIFVAFNGSTTFTSVGSITATGAQGVLTAPLANHADPDTVDTLSVDMIESDTEPTPVTHDDADALRTLSLVVAQPTVVGGASVIPNNGELLSFGDVSTTGSFTADLTYLRRGQFGTTPSAHSTGDQFTVLDATEFSGTTLLYSLPPQYIGVPISIKFCSFNNFSQNQQDLASVIEYQYTPTGIGYGGGTSGIPLIPTGLTAVPGAGQIFVAWAANLKNDNVTSYKLYAAPGLGSLFSSSVLIWQGAALNYTHTGLNAGVSFTYFVVAENLIGDSSNTAGSSATALAPGSTSYINSIIVPVCVVSALPSPALGTRGFVTDATMTLIAGLGTPVIGGGANKVPVYADGSVWYIG